jgi:prevent-host-death family protein
MVKDYGKVVPMEQMAISKFKATCLAVLERVRQTGQPILVTRFGEPVAEINPASVRSKMKRKLGVMAGTGRIVGDIIAPAVDSDDWEVLR